MTQLETINQWQELLERSNTENILVFKHSNTCPVSANAYQNIDKGLAEKMITEPIYIVVVQEHRDVSNQIAEDLGVKHESPQILIIKKRKAIYSESHWKIKAKKISEALTWDVIPKTFE